MTSLRKSHRQHAGELDVQRKRGVPPHVSASIVGAIHDEMPRRLVEFYRAQPFLPLGVTDAAGRPWITLLCNPETSAPTADQLRVRARVNPADPFVAAVSAPRDDVRHFAGVAIDFAARSRVKLAGVIDAATLDDAHTLTLTLSTHEHMGNCPKYITARQLRPTRRVVETTALHATLSPAARALLREASTAFIATRHVDADPRESDMGVNHRGGPKGFLRYFEDARGGHLVLPDYSGNRFYQSLGNVETDPVMAIAVPDFATGALLQVSGRARNLFDDEAARLMPGASLVTLLTIDEVFLTTGALDLELVGAEEPSAYNPRLRTLAADRTAVAMKATLVGVTRETARISTFTFALPAPVEVVPGGYAVFDFSEHVRRVYQHMNDRDPQSLNDDYVRTFTVSKVSADRRALSITVKKSGVISSFLHAQSPGPAPLTVDLAGFGGTFTCFDHGRALPHMLWVAGGVGVTPFLAMYRALEASGQPMPEIELWYACRHDERELVRELTAVRVRIFDSKASTEPPGVGPREIHHRRMGARDFAEAPLLERATVFVCGPEGLMNDVLSWLDGRVDASRIRLERFAF